MPQFKITTRITLLVLLPIIFEIVAIIGSLELQHQTELARRSVHHSSQVALLANAILSLEIQRGSLQFSDSATKRADMSLRRRQVEQTLHSEKIAMDSLLDGNPQEKASWARMKQLGELLNRGYRNARELYDNGNVLAAASLWYSYQHYLDELFDLSSELSSKQRNQGQLDEYRLEQLIKQTRFLLVAMIVGGLLLTGGVLAVFNNSVSRRFKLIAANAELLASGLPATHEVPGNDEFSRLNENLNRLFGEVNTLRRKEKAILENINDGICTLDAEFRIVDINLALARIWKASKAESVNNNLVDLLSGFSLELVRGSLADARLGNPVMIDVPMEVLGSSDQTSWSISWSAADELYYCVIRDTSEQFRLERLRHDLIAMVSHDMRSPLTSIQLLFDLVLEESQSPLSSFTVKKLLDAKISVTNLIKLMNSLLQLEKGQNSILRLNLERFSLTKLYKESVDMLLALIQKKDLTVLLGVDDIEVSADRDKIRQVLVNLLSNACKYAPTHTEIRIYNFIRDSKVRVCVQDRGPGVEHGKHTQIFKKFNDLSAIDSLQGKGAGVGLSLCKWIIESHGGQIGVNSDGSTGSVFWFEIPI